MNKLKSRELSKKYSPSFFFFKTVNRDVNDRIPTIICETIMLLYQILSITDLYELVGNNTATVCVCVKGVCHIFNLNL